MKLILISCSGKKAPGGQADLPPSKLADYLSPAAKSVLLNARRELADLLWEMPEHDLGFHDAGDKKYQPAFQRYQGFIYLYSDFYRLFPKFQGRVLIISAMYGLLDGGDYVRNYNLRLNDYLPTGLRVETFWKQHGLRDILLDGISNAGVDEVHDLLPEKYRNLLSPWPAPGIKNHKSYTFPASGQGTGYERPATLKSLLSK